MKNVLPWKCGRPGLGGLVVWQWKAVCSVNGDWDYWYSSWALLSVFLTHFRHCYLRAKFFHLSANLPPPISEKLGGGCKGKEGHGILIRGDRPKKIQMGKLTPASICDQNASSLNCFPKQFNPKYQRQTHIYLSLNLRWGEEEGDKGSCTCNTKHFNMHICNMLDN